MELNVTLSDKTTIPVKRLGIFELDNLTPEPIGYFTYKMKALTGNEYDVEFDPSLYDEPPTKPEQLESEIEEGTPEWYQLMDWQLYQGAMLHEKKRRELVNEYKETVAKYILNRCVSENDQKLITTQEDWENVYNAALVPQLTIELLTETLNKTYNAEFLGKNVFEAMESLEKGTGHYNTLRLWENKLMIEMRMTEVEYAMLPLEERARKVCALFLEPIMSSLESDHRDKTRNKA